MSGSLVLHNLPEFAQTHIHWAGDAIQPSHPLSPPSPPALNLPQHQGLFQWVFTLCSQSIGASASAFVRPVNFQDWFPLGLTGLISLQSKGLSRVFSNTTVQEHQFFSTVFFMVQLLHPYMTTEKTIALTIWTLVGKVMSLLSNTVSNFVPRRKHLLISRPQSPSTMMALKKIKLSLLPLFPLLFAILKWWDQMLWS